jgi:hypothetical protein
VLTFSEPRQPGRLGPETWKLRGAARPWAELPENREGPAIEDENGRAITPYVDGADKWNGLMGKFSADPETREYLSVLFKFAEACCESGFTNQACEHYEEALRLDKEDKMGARARMVSCLMDDGEAQRARGVIDADTTGNAAMQYHKAMIEFVAWSINDEVEGGACEELATAELKKAFDANPYFLVWVVHENVFNQVVEYVNEIKEWETQPGSVEEAFVVAGRDGPLWAETDGALEWAAGFLADQEEENGGELPAAPEPPAPEEGQEPAPPSMYVGMYETAVGVIGEQSDSESDGEPAEDGWDNVDPEKVKSAKTAGIDPDLLVRGAKVRCARGGGGVGRSSAGAAVSSRTHARTQLQSGSAPLHSTDFLVSA